MSSRTVAVVSASLVVLGVGALAVMASASETATTTTSTTTTTTATTTASATTPEAASEAPSYLSILEAGQGRFIEHSSTSYELRLTDVDEDGLFFTERPQHQAGEDTTESILDHFFKAGTGAPNAVVRVEDASNGQDTLIVELSSPEYDKDRDTLTLRAKPLLTASPGLTRFETTADSSLPKRFDDVTLFVDLDSQFCQVSISAAERSLVFQNIQIERDFGDTVYPNTTAATPVLGLTQYGTWDYGCGATVTADVWTNTTPDGTSPTPGTQLGSFTYSYSNPEIGHNSDDMATRGVVAQTTDPDPSGNQPTWIYTISAP